jgi:glutathione S-transferase
MPLATGPVSLAEARALPGLRLVVVPGVPSPWGEAAKGILYVKRIPHVRAIPMPSDPPGALQDWTKQDAFPAAMYENERPRSGWAEILWLAERLAPEPALVPRDPEQRALFFGLCHELCGEEGLGWMRRIEMVHAGLARGDKLMRWLGEKYGYRPDVAARAPQRVRDVLRALDAQLQRHGKYLMGDALSALDVYFATFLNLVSPLPPDLLRLPDFLREATGRVDPEVARILAGGLLAHRDRVYREHLELPVVL